jgi:hypothetical protein
VRQQNVTLGAQEGNFYEIVEGLKGNEMLAASSLNEITTGMKVTLLDGGAKSAEGAPSGNVEKTEKADKPAGEKKRGGKGKRQSAPVADGGNN